MVTLIEKPTLVESVGNKPKVIEEYVGRVNTGDEGVSIAKMKSPEGWKEPGQRPAFQEITIVLKGFMRVEHEGGVLDVKTGQAVIAKPDAWVRYSTPGPEGAEYVSVCMPAFSPDTVHRDSREN
jgi:mannose-6-phosphate isomerase-like protein (cupin superfamily)